MKSPENSSRWFVISGLIIVVMSAICYGRSGLVEPAQPALNLMDVKITPHHSIALPHLQRNPNVPYRQTGRPKIFHRHNENREYKLKLDSMVYVEYAKYVYTYNNSGDVTLTTVDEWIGGEWVKSINYKYTYNNSGDIITQNLQMWEEDLWVDYMKGEFTYDTNGNLLTQVFQMWEEDQWNNFVKHEYTYDTDGKLIAYNNYSGTSRQWENATKNEYTYDSNGNATRVIVYLWESDKWANSQKNEFSYSNSGYILIGHFYTWEDSLWVNFEKYEYTYNSSDNTSLCAVYSWEEDQWANYEKGEYTYDNNDNMVLYIWYEWEETQWVNSEKYEGFYNLSVNFNDVKYPNVLKIPDVLTWPSYWYGNAGTNIADSGKNYYWKDSTSTWEIELDGKMYFSPLIVPIINNPSLSDKYAKNPLTLQSNRVGSLLSLTNHTGSDIDLSIYSLNGKRVKRVIVPEAGMIIDISSLASGIYFFKYSHKNTVFPLISFVKWK